MYAKVYVEITNICNMNCSFCHGHSRTPGRMTADQFRQVLYPVLSLTPGTVLRANCYKCGDLTLEPHYLSWNPVTSAKPDFHRPCDFGRMVLG